MKLLVKKTLLSLSVCAGLLTASMHVSFVNAQQPTDGDMVSTMADFEKLTPEQQKKQLKIAKNKSLEQVDTMIKQASTSEEKQRLEYSKKEIIKQIDILEKMTPEERKALVAKAQASINQQTINLTSEQKAALEKYKATQDVK